MHGEGSTQAGVWGKSPGSTGPICRCLPRMLHSQVLSLCQSAGGPRPSGSCSAFLYSLSSSLPRALEKIMPHLPSNLLSFSGPHGPGTSLRWGLKWESLFQVWELLAQPDPHAVLQAWERPLVFTAECRGREMDLLPLSCLNLNSFFTALEPPVAQGCQFS